MVNWAISKTSIFDEKSRARPVTVPVSGDGRDSAPPVCGGLAPLHPPLPKNSGKNAGDGGHGPHPTAGKNSACHTPQPDVERGTHPPPKSQGDKIREGWLRLYQGGPEGGLPGGRAMGPCRNLLFRRELRRVQPAQSSPSVRTVRAISDAHGTVPPLLKMERWKAGQ
jgi:hypothetical protein